MFDKLKKLKYGVRVLLSRGGGQPETIDVAGRPTVLMHGGDGPPFVYLHSALGEGSQQHHLRFHRQVADFIEENHPSVGGFEEPSMI